MKARTAAAIALVIAAPAWAGPPYITDDPATTDPGKWEIYAFAAGEGRGSTLDGDAGLDLNYGAGRDLQLTATLPLTVSHDRLQGWKAGTGDAELAVKYRFFNDEPHGLSAALFPRVVLPTSSLDTDERTALLLPLWVEKDLKGGTSLFGGGGYEYHPGSGNRSFWQAGVAVTQDLSDKLSLGAEVTRQGADSAGGTAQTRAGIGSIVKLSDHYALLFSGGPTWAEHRTLYHFYAALGLFF